MTSMRLGRRGRAPLTPADVARAIVAAGALMVVDVSTRALGVARTSRGLAALAQHLPAAPVARPSLDRRVSSLVATLRRAARALVWGGDCLPRALLLWTWLRWAGEEPSLVLGVRRDGGIMASHAWVVWQGQAIGEPDDVESEYVTFSDPLQVTRPPERDVGQ